MWHNFLASLSNGATGLLAWWHPHTNTAQQQHIFSSVCLSVCIHVCLYITRKDVCGVWVCVYVRCECVWFVCAWSVFVWVWVCVCVWMGLGLSPVPSHNQKQLLRCSCHSCGANRLHSDQWLTPTASLKSVTSPDLKAKTQQVFSFFVSGVLCWPPACPCKHSGISSRVQDKQITVVPAEFEPAYFKTADNLHNAKGVQVGPLNPNKQYQVGFFRNTRISNQVGRETHERQECDFCLG